MDGSNALAINQQDLDDLLELEREKCKTDLYYLCRYILGYDLCRPMPHKVVDKFINRNDRKPFLHIELARSTFKSTVVTIGYSIQRLIRNPACRILIDNKTFADAKSYLSAIRAHLKNNKKLLELFPHLKLNDKVSGGDTEQSIIIVGNPTFKDVSYEDSVKIQKEPNVSCAGVDKTRTGQHYDVIIMDDLVSESNVTTPEQIKKVKDHFRLAFSLLDPPSEDIYREVIVIGTRFHFDDLYSMLLSEEFKDLFDTLIMPAILHDGSSSFPERLTKDFLSMQKRIQGTYIYNCQYMLNPVDENNSDFKQSWVRYWRGYHYRYDNKNYILIEEEYIVGPDGGRWYKYDKPKRERVTVVMTFDPASKKKKVSDYNGVIITAITRANKWYILDIYHDKWNPTERVNILFEVYDKYHADVFAIESVGFQETIKFYAQEKMGKVNKFFTIRELSHHGRQKHDRIRGLIPRFENGCIYLPVSCSHKNWENTTEDNVKKLLDEMVFFPFYKFDDLLDTLAYLLDIVKPSKGNTNNTRNGRVVTGRSAIIRR
jgi:phage terminase large subunit-like protein